MRCAYCALRGLILGAVMRKLLCVTYGVLKSGRPFDPSLHSMSG